MHRLAEVAVFVTRREGAEVLLLHRAPDRGGYWHVVAGGVEPGEDAAAAAQRELLEETGLAATARPGVEVSEYVFVSSGEPAPPTSHDASVARVEVSCFTSAAPDDWEPTLDEEHDAHRWCTLGEAVAALRWPGTAEGLRKLLTTAAR